AAGTIYGQSERRAAVAAASGQPTGNSYDILILPDQIRPLDVVGDCLRPVNLIVWPVQVEAANAPANTGDDALWRSGHCQVNPFNGARTRAVMRPVEPVAFNIQGQRPAFKGQQRGERLAAQVEQLNLGAVANV